jgi:hypothetical protein
MGGGAIGIGPILSLQSFSSAASSRRGCGALGLRRLLPSLDVTPESPNLPLSRAMAARHPNNPA